MNSTARWRSCSELATWPVALSRGAKRLGGAEGFSSWLWRAPEPRATTEGSVAAVEARIWTSRQPCTPRPAREDPGTARRCRAPFQEERIGGQLEVAGQMGLELKGVPDPSRCGRRHPRRRPSTGETSGWRRSAYPRRSSPRRAPPCRRSSGATSPDEPRRRAHRVARPPTVEAICPPLPVQLHSSDHLLIGGLVALCAGQHDPGPERKSPAPSWLAWSAAPALRALLMSTPEASSYQLVSAPVLCRKWALEANALFAANFGCRTLAAGPRPTMKRPRLVVLPGNWTTQFIAGRRRAARGIEGPHGGAGVRIVRPPGPSPAASSH